MDYRALAELVWFTLLGLSVLALTTGIVVRVVLKPFLSDLIDVLRERSMSGGHVAERLARIESRLVELDHDVHGLRTSTEFDRRLEAGDKVDDG